MQKLKLFFELEGNEIKPNYNSAILSFIKKSIQLYDGALFEELYGKKNTTMKSYTFSVYLPNPVFSKNSILLGGNRLTVNFSTYDLKDLIVFYNAFLMMKGKKFNLENNSMVLKNLVLKNGRDITENRIIIKMLSPLIVRKHIRETNDDLYLSCYDDGFETVLKDNIKYAAQKLKLDIETDDFSIVPIKPKKTVVNCFNQLINANIGVFMLEGNQKLLNFLYYAGVGSKRSAGFGCFEVIC